MINPPPTRSNMTDESGQVKPEWIEFFSSVFYAIQAHDGFGTTANRPTKGLYVGRPYFDTSLGANGKPIWVNKNGNGWITADGNSA